MRSSEPERSLEGWDPGPVNGGELAYVVERAFDYRGDVTLVRRDGGEVVGYLFNRSAEGPAPFVQVLGREGGGPVTIPYADIVSIRFSGRDTAAGSAYEAWLRSREAPRMTRPASGV